MKGYIFCKTHLESLDVVIVCIFPNETLKFKCCDLAKNILKSIIPVSEISDIKKTVGNTVM